MPIPQSWLDAVIVRDSVPLVLKYGDEEGRIKFLTLPDNYAPYFYIRKKQLSDAKRLLLKYGAEVGDEEGIGADGHRVVKVVCQDERTREVLYEKLESSDIVTYEADVSLVKRVAIDYDIYQCPVSRVAYLDIEVQAEEEFPVPYRATQRLLSIAVVGSDGREEFISERDEAEMYRQLTEVLRRYQVVTGWNWERFDKRYLLMRAKNLRVPFSFFPLQDIDSLWIYQRVRILMKIGGTGRSRLEDVARELLGIEHKSVKTVEDFRRLRESFETDKKELREHNLTDARIVAELNNRYGILKPFFDLATRYPGLTIRETSSMLRVWDTILLWKARQYRTKDGCRIVLPTMREGEDILRGGDVFTPLRGVHRSVIGLDFKALYPSIVHTFELSPEMISLYQAWKASGLGMEEWYEGLQG